MNYWTQLSVSFANQRNYLDELYKVYPIAPNLRREIPRQKADRIAEYFRRQENQKLVEELLTLDLFPLKDSYVPYLRRDPSAIMRNPNTINRIAGNLYAMGLDTLFDKCTEPKETNRQMGPMFKNWLESGVLGCKICKDPQELLATEENAVLITSDAIMKTFAMRYLGYTRERKGLDFIAKFNGKYIIAEAKFLTDFGGHQNDQFEDAISTLTSAFNPRCREEVVKIAIVDGVLYIEGKNKLYKYLEEHNDEIILSALVLREFLYSV